MQFEFEKLRDPDERKRMIALRPSVTQIKARLRQLKLSGKYDITNYAELMAWAQPRLMENARMCDMSSEELEKWRYDSGVVVLRTFERDIQLPVLDDDNVPIVKDGKPVMRRAKARGIVFNSKAWDAT